MLNRPNMLFLAAIVFLLVACAAVGFHALFSSFMPYDDEGLFLLGSRLYLEGHTFYKDIPWTYGPIYLAMVELLHDYLAIPLTHSAARFVALFSWLSLALVCAWLVLRLSGSRLWALVSLVLSFLFVGSIANEPGHPQAVVAIGMITVPLLASFGGGAGNRYWWMLIGLAVGAISHIKLNAGAFSLAALMMVLTCTLRTGFWRSMLQGAAVLASMLLPFVLMFPLLAEPNSVAFAAIVALSAVAVALALLPPLEPSIDARGMILPAVAGFSLITLMALVYAGLNGASPLDIFGSLLSYSASQIEFYHFFRSYTALQLALAMLSVMLALMASRGAGPATQSWQVLLARCWLVCAAIYALLIDNPANSQAMLGYAGPWCWAVMMPPVGAGRTPARMLLAATAVWSPLLAYPIPGSQMYFGSLPILLCAIICAADLVQWWLRRGSPAPAVTRIISPALLALACALGALYIEYLGARSAYLGFRPLGLPGTELMRIEARRGKYYRELVSAMNQADVTLLTFRLHSLYLWSTPSAPVEKYLPYYALTYASPAEQQRFALGLVRAEKPLVVTRALPGSARLEADELGWIDVDYKPYRTIGPYTLMGRETARAGASVDQ